MSDESKNLSLFWLFFFAVVCLAAYICKGVIFPFLTGACLAYIFAPLSARISKKINPTIASLLCTFLLLGTLVSVFWTFIPFAKNEIEIFINNTPEYIRKFTEIAEKHINTLQQHGIDINFAKDEIYKYFANNINLIATYAVKIITHGDVITNFFSALFIIPLTMFYMLRDWNELDKKLVEWIPIRHRNSVKILQCNIRNCLFKFMNGQIVVSILLTIYYTPCLMGIGIEHYIFWGIISGFASFIPFLGAIFCLLSVSFISILSNFSVIKIAMCVCIYLLGQFCEGYILSPRFVGKEVNIHPLFLLFAFFLGINLAGVIGVMVCIPCAAIFAEISRFTLKNLQQSTFFKR